MSAPILTCSACGSPAAERSAVVQDCSCGCRKVVYRPAMNWQERARRAEMLAEQLATDLDALTARVALMNWTEGNPAGSALVPDCRATLARWRSHQADLATLEGRDG